MKRGRAAALAVAALLALPAAAAAHLERPAYWPDPAPDTSVSPAAGGQVPKARTLASALDRKQRRNLRVACKPNSLKLANASIKSARRSGYEIRPSQGRLSISSAEATRLRALNRRFFALCRYRDIQAAVNKARNNGRVVVMPGTYIEEPSRRQPEDDPRCDQFENADGSLQYRYHVSCPNDANLIALIGRKPGPDPPDPARPDRHGIPDIGPCIRCNVQIEGSGVGPHDVRIEAAEDPATPLRKAPEKYAKDVGLVLERADGAVVRNITIAHAEEHDIYVKETDGYLIDRVRLFWGRAYGALMFTSDHGVFEDSDAAGSGDSSVYPGAAPDTGEQTVEAAPRVNQVIRRNDLHHSAIGCSCAAMGNGLLIENNDAYDNGTGISADSLGASAHPGYPQDSGRVIGNRIYSNNFNMYAEGSDVPPVYFTVVGVGLALWGGNGNLYADNRIWDNWRYGAMLFALPTDWAGDYYSGPPNAGQSTSYNNRYTRNVMGIAPDGTAMPNGIDFWWDSFPGTTGNRWCDNTGVGGKVTSDPAALPGCDGPSVGTGDPDNMAEFYGCGALLLTSGPGDPTCEWWRSPTAPGASGGAPAGNPLVGSRSATSLAPTALRKADCRDWSAASSDERRATVERLRRFFSQNLPAGSPPQALPDGDGYELLAKVCARERAGDFLLWGIYMQAAGFSGYGQAYEAKLRLGDRGR